MFNLLDLIIKHFYNLTQWSNKLYDRFTVKRTWTTTNGNTGQSSCSSSVSSFGNIVHIHLTNQKSSNFSTGNIDNEQTSTIDAEIQPHMETYYNLYFLNTSPIYGGHFKSIRAFYCLSVIDGGLKSISCAAPSVSTYTEGDFVGNTTTLNYGFMFEPSVNAVQTADKYVQFGAVTVGNMYSLNPYTLIRS